MAKAQPSPGESFPLEPRPRTSIWAMLLCVANIAAVAGFFYLMNLDLQKRRVWIHNNMIVDAANQGKFTLQTMIFEPAALKLHLAIGECPSSALPLKELDLKPLFSLN